jgi:hypothetical protein
MDFRLLLVLFVLAPLAARAIDRDEERTFAVEPGCTLKVDLFRGAIDVRETDAAEITVVAHLSLAAKTPEEADRLVAALGFAATQEGDTVSVRASDPEGSGVRFTWDEKSRVNLECQIFVPRRCSVELRTREGPVTVGNLAGRVFVRTNRGNVFIRRIDGTIDAATKSGDLIVSRCSGAVTAATEYGTLRVGTLGGRAVLRNGGGDIEVLDAHASLDVEACPTISPARPKSAPLTAASSPKSIRRPTASCRPLRSGVMSKTSCRSRSKPAATARGSSPAG